MRRKIKKEMKKVREHSTDRKLNAQTDRRTKKGKNAPHCVCQHFRALGNDAISFWLTFHECRYRRRRRRRRRHRRRSRVKHNRQPKLRIELPMISIGMK